MVIKKKKKKLMTLYTPKTNGIDTSNHSIFKSIYKQKKGTNMFQYILHQSLSFNIFYISHLSK